jgi:AcrR family transcriptional regulator
MNCARIEDMERRQAAEATPASSARSRRAPGPDERRRDPERTRERILDAALTEFAARGYAGARVNEIAERAGVNKQLISYYFGGKEGLYRAIASSWRRQETEASTEQQRMTLAELVTSYLPRSAHQRSLVRLLFWDGLMPAGGDPGGEERGSRMREAVADLERRQRDGELADDIDPGCFLLAFMAAASAPAALPHLTRSITGLEPDSPEFLERYAEQLGRMVRHLAKD